MRSDNLLALATGLLGGFGHCVGMCGPLVAAMSLAGGPADPRRVLAGHLLYNAGRVTTYGFIGAAMGLSPGATLVRQGTGTPAARLSAMMSFWMTGTRHKSVSTPRSPRCGRASRSR